MLSRIVMAGAILLVGFALYPGLKTVTDSLYVIITDMFPSLPTIADVYLQLTPALLIGVILLMAGWVLFKGVGRKEN